MIDLTLKEIIDRFERSAIEHADVAAAELALGRGRLRKVALARARAETWNAAAALLRPLIGADGAAAEALAKASPPKRAKKERAPSRPERWVAACAKLSAALDDAEAAIEELRGMQEEFESWKDGLPESFQGSALGEKLDAICGIDLSSGIDDVRAALDEAEGADLPLGFGRD